MTLYDWVVLAVVAALLIRGWRRGLVREAIDVGVLLVGTVLVFRLSPVLGTILAGMANIPYEVARIVAGGIVLVLLVVGSMVLGSVVSTALRVVPGAGALDTFGGSVVGLAYAAVVIALGTTVASAAPMPATSADAFDRAVERSVVGRTIVDPGGSIQPLVEMASGDHLYRSVIAVRGAVGERFMAGTLPVPFPSVNAGELAPSQTLAQTVFDEVNEERIASGADPLAWSSDLAIVSVARASAVYQSGVLSLDDGLSAALRSAGIPGTTHDDLVVMAASTDGLVEAIMDAPAYAAAIGDPIYRKAAIGVVDGPYGLMAVQVLSG